MNVNTIRRLVAIMLVLALAFGITACMSDPDTGIGGTSNGGTSNGGTSNGGTSNGGTSNGGTSNGGTGNGGTSNGGTSNGGTSNGGDSEGGLVQGTQLSDPDLRYVMIYNPKVYDENTYADRSALKVGAFGSQIDVFGDRGDGMETDPEFISISQQEWLKYLPEEIELEGNRADGIGTDYNLGDKQFFYYSSNGNNMSAREQQEFTCSYVGEYCYIWTVAGAEQSIIDDLGKEFDETIYEGVVDVFGTPRFVGETGKVNLLLYNLDGGLLGYFAPLDLFVESEHVYVGLEGATCNTGHALLNINASLLGSSRTRELAYSTVAHELQHLINFTAFFETVNAASMHTWLNEGMSGYIETELYAAAKELSGHDISFNQSGLIRNGQSLYNFTTGYFDVGVYGSVYYFSKYLEKMAGKDVFSNIMDYWRESYSISLCTSEALVESIPDSLYDQIDNSIDYTALNLRFADETEEWMSKLTLNFYLAYLSNDLNIAAFDKINTDALLYDSIDSAVIEGGGRLIVALTEDTFDIPEDSESGLIYIGLDKDFQPITEFVY